MEEEEDRPTTRKAGGGEVRRRHSSQAGRRRQTGGNLFSPEFKLHFRAPSLFSRSLRNPGKRGGVSDSARQTSERAKERRSGGAKGGRSVLSRRRTRDQTISKRESGEASEEMGGVEVGRAAALRMIVIVEGEIAKKCNSRLLPSFHVSPSPSPFFLSCLRFRPSRGASERGLIFMRGAVGGWTYEGANEGTLKVNGNEGGSKRAGKGLGGQGGRGGWK